MSTSKARTKRHITPREAYRAIYIDFEGFKDQSPALLGIVCEYDIRQVVCAPYLQGAAVAKVLPFMALEQIGREILDRSVAEDRLVVGFSMLEANQFLEHAGIDLGDRYRNARIIAKRWINSTHPGVVPEWTLTELMRFMGYTEPPHLGKGLVTKRLDAVRRGLEVNGGDYSKITATQKAKWTKLLRYNVVDCLGTRDLVLRAAAEMAAKAGSSHKLDHHGSASTT